MLKILAGHMMNHQMVAAEGRPTSCGPPVFPAFASACNSVLAPHCIFCFGPIWYCISGPAGTNNPWFLNSFLVLLLVAFFGNMLSPKGWHQKLAKIVRCLDLIYFTMVLTTPTRKFNATNTTDSFKHVPGQHFWRFFCQPFGENTFPRKHAKSKINPNIVISLMLTEW